MSDNTAAAKTIVITGTASGFGRATVQRFAREGWNVVATVRKTDDLHIHDDLPTVRTLLYDVNDEAGAEAFASDATAAFGRVDALVNNAGYYYMGPVEAGTMEQVHAQFQTNVFGLIAITKAFLPTFRTQRSGVIVNISSISADQGYPYTAVYSASKAAVAAFTEGLNVELADFGVSAKAVLPGSHATRIFTKIDVAKDVPEDYQAGIARFFAGEGTGSLPEVTAEVIYEAVTDGKQAKVRYYSGPDSAAIPRVKQLLGADWYWEEFRNAATGNPSPLWQSLTPRGTHEIEFAI
jgi:NAD(P)-dependent dehydrogenase (short-subunit alcohol dehydrogenase family)